MNDRLIPDISDAIGIFHQFRKFFTKRKVNGLFLALQLMVMFRALHRGRFGHGGNRMGSELSLEPRNGATVAIGKNHRAAARKRFAAIAASNRTASACCSRHCAVSLCIFSAKGSPSSSCTSAPT